MTLSDVDRTSTPHVASGPLRVLFVCTGNICRSPMAERLFLAQRAAQPRRPRPVPLLRAASAGVRAVVGHPMDEPSAAVLRTLGAQPDGHVAAQLTRQDVSDADLILTASTRQRSFVLRYSPAAMRRVFTLREFARLAASLDGSLAPDAASSPEQLRARIAVVANQRGAIDPTGATDEIADPFKASTQVVVRVAHEIRDAVAVVAGTLR